MKIVIATGGFDPIHSGHIEYLKAAKKLGDTLMVGVNSDEWLQRKKGAAFMPLYERMLIVSSLAVVDAAYRFDDTDGTAISIIESMKEQYPDAEIIFANGGDRTSTNIPEMCVTGVEFVFGVGGDNKANSSSWILQEWKAPKTERPWGYYRVLHDVAGTKVKELTVEPGQSLSMQRHTHRAEHWHVSEGSCIIERDFNTKELLNTHQTLDIKQGDWHKLTNPFKMPCKIVEIQYGSRCDEEDIERK